MENEYVHFVWISSQLFAKKVLSGFDPYQQTIDICPFPDVKTARTNIRNWSDINALIIHAEIAGIAQVQGEISAKTGWIKNINFCGDLYVLMENSRPVMAKASKYLGAIRTIASFLILPENLEPDILAQTILTWFFFKNITLNPE